MADQQQNDTQSQKQRVSPPMDNDVSKTQKKSKEGMSDDKSAQGGSCGTSKDDSSCGCG